MRNVVELDRHEREKRQKMEHDGRASGSVEQPAPTAMSETSSNAQPNPGAEADSDSEYEEVEVTDDEEDNDRLSEKDMEETDANQVVEFDEDDIAYQLQAMGHDYGLDPGEYGNQEDEKLEDGAEGLPLTEQDAKALFIDMLNDHRINPYKTWDALIEAGQIIDDDRYTVLPSMRLRKEVWAEWSGNRIKEMKEQREREAKKDPKIPFLTFLQAHATPKLYWPEFRRKFQKEPEMRNTKLMDKDREKYYREYINRESSIVEGKHNTLTGFSRPQTPRKYGEG